MGIPGFDDVALWKKTNVEFKKISTVFKDHPHFPKQASVFSSESVSFMLDITPEQANISFLSLLQKKAVMILTVICGMRMRDVYNTVIDNVSFHGRQDRCPRYVKILLDKTKTDPNGEGPESSKYLFLSTFINFCFFFFI